MQFTDLFIYVTLGFMSDREKLSVTDYLETANREILRRGVYPFSCGVVAFDIAKILLGDDLRPTIVGLEGPPINSVGDRRRIVPKVFNGTVGWGSHLVCVHEELALDPIIGEPMDFATYLEEAFTERPESTRTFHQEEFDQFIANRAAMIQDVRDGAPFIVLTDVG